MNNFFIISILIIIILMYFLITTGNTNKEYINILLRQSARWSLAAQQDKSPLVSLLHANYGASYLWALKDIATDKEIESVSNVNILEFKKKIINIQDDSTKKVSSLCPEFIGHVDPYLLKIGGDL